MGDTADPCGFRGRELRDVTPSTPAAPLLAATFPYACHTARLEMSNGFPGDTCSPT